MAHCLLIYKGSQVQILSARPIETAPDLRKRSSGLFEFVGFASGLQVELASASSIVGLTCENVFRAA